MLTLEPPIYSTQVAPKGLTVFRDHADPDQLYLLPGRPRIAIVDGKPRFDLIKYRRDLTDNPALDPTRARGAGLLFCEVEVPVDNLAAVAADIAAQTGRDGARVSPVTFTSIEARAVIAHPDGDRLIEDLVESHAAPLSAPYHTAFALALSAEGATLVERAAAEGTLPIGVSYEARFLALAPSLHARVTMKYGRIFDQFSAALGFTYYVNLGLDFNLQKLIEDGAVQIEITRFTDQADGDRQRELVMKIVQARIQQDFFRSAIPTSEENTGGALKQLLGTMGGTGKTTSATAMFVLKARLDVVKEDKDFVLTLDGRTTVELSHTMASTLSAMAPDGTATHAREIDLDDPFFSELRVDVAPAIDFAALADLVEADVEVWRGDVRKGVALGPATAAPFVFRAPLTHPTDDEYQYRADFHFDTEKGAGPALISIGPTASRRRVLVIDPGTSFRYRRVRFVLGPLDPSLVPRVHVLVRVPAGTGDDRARVELTLDAESPEHTFRMRALLSEPPIDVVVDTAWEDPAGVRHSGDSGLPVEGSDFLVLGPYRDVLSVLVEPVVDWSRTTQVLVELRYRDGELAIERRLSFTAAGKSAGQTVNFPLREGAPRTYEWSQTLLPSDGLPVVQSDWVKSDRSVLVAGPAKSTTGLLKLVWLGTPGDALALRVDLWVQGSKGEEQQSEIVRPGEDRTLTLPLDESGKLHYRYEVKKLLASGEALLLKSGDTDSPLLVMQTP